MEAIRAFIAIELPAALRQHLGEVEKEIQSRAGEGARRAVRWVPVENMHLTLKFLGEVSTGSLEALSRMLQVEAARHKPFSLMVGGLGAFPNLRRPRVIWVGLEAPPDLLSLQHSIEAETSRLGYPAEERPFSPHLTLGRIAQNALPTEVALVSRVLGDTSLGAFGQVQVDQLHLFRSDLRPGGAVYTSLQVFPLHLA